MKLDSTDLPNHGLDVDTRIQASVAIKTFEAAHRAQIAWDSFLERLEILMADELDGTDLLLVSDAI